MPAALLSCGGAAPVKANVVATKHTRNEPAKAAKQKKLAARNSRSDSGGVPFRRLCRDNPIFEPVPTEAPSVCGLHIGGHVATPRIIPDVPDVSPTFFP